MKGKIKKSSFPEIPEDIYKAKLIQIKKDKSRRGPILLWKFEIRTKGPYFKRWVTSITDQEATRSNRLGKFIAVFDPDLDEGDDFDTDDYIGKKVRIMTANRKGETQTFANVVKVLPLKSSEDVGEDERVNRKKKKYSDRDARDDDSGY